MHTLMVLSAGFVLLAIMYFAGGRLAGSQGRATAALAFVPIWFIAAAYNMYVGVTSAGYSVAAEAPVLAVVFGLPAAAALVLRLRLTRGPSTSSL